MDRDFLAANLLSPAYAVALKVPLDAKLGTCGDRKFFVLKHAGEVCYLCIKKKIDDRKLQFFYLCNWSKRSGVDDCALVMIMA